MKKIARNLREAPEEKRLPNRRLQRSFLVVYVSGSYCAAWAADSSILPLVLLLSLAYISGGGGVNSVPSRALLTFGVLTMRLTVSFSLPKVTPSKLHRLRTSGLCS